MHVLILPSWYFPAGSLDIKGRMFHQFAASLRKNGMDARIFFADFSLNSPFWNEIIFSEEDGVPTWRVRRWFPPKVHATMIDLWIRKYVRCLMDYIEKEGVPDIIHAQSYLTANAAAALKRKTGIPFIYTERLSQFITGGVPERYKTFLKNTLEEASLITGVSPGLKKHLQLYTSRNIEIVPNFYVPDIFYHDPSVKKNNTFTWISMGEPAHVKGLDVLIDAYGQFRKKNPANKMQLIMIDRIKEKEELMQIVNRYELGSEIIWKGLLSQYEIAVLLRCSHVLISASRTETFGKAILEAQACGLPIIATKTDGAGYIISSEDQGMLVEINDTLGLGEAMHEMFSHYKRYDPEKITNSVASRFKEDVVIGQWQEIYRKVAS